jgi:hypothetical protein
MKKTPKKNKSVYHFDHVNISKDDMIKLLIITYKKFMSIIISLNLFKFLEI